ncbi:hypothetical protein [Pseudoalteromonas apostichopi]|uniref:hypothetical protein n=1 Tax=Pseudoalteromonas apostichopi TaxID=3035452 RepID=UPI00257263A0|nr:hypothetical protein [Pseudoalteromonas sp. FE4]
MTEILIGILGSLIATAITAKYYTIKYNIGKNNKIVNLFNINTDKDIRICYANIQSTSDYVSPVSSLIPSGSFDYGDADSILLVYDKFRTHYHRLVRWVRNEIPATSKNGNLITIAGPKWNKSTEQLLGEMGSPLYYSSGVNGLIEKRATHKKENIHKFNFREVNGTIVAEDYGCLVCARNNALGKDIDSAVIVSGYTTFGTLFAAEALHSLTKEEVKNISKSVEGDNKFAILVKGNIKLDLDGKIASPATVEIVTWIGERDFLAPYEYSY